MSTIDELERRISVLESILRRVVTTHNGINNPLAMIGHNIGVDGMPANPGVPSFNLQLEGNYDDGMDRWVEMNLDCKRPNMEARRYMMLKAIRESHDFVSWSFHIEGDGYNGRAISSFSVCGPSNIDTAGPRYMWVDGRGDTYVSGGLYWAPDEKTKPFMIGRMDNEGTFHIGDSERPVIVHNAKLKR